ncbi:hypothetical protein NQ314_010489 [Rhamnusium bicolor]|uniref:Uncharacterized protein n=1 Tax=Rhamnusium bicolor TaxID=1586634 RepID=A0AAV8XQL1_9CUCU|nr:hypothetical protein NQ314_010489 [Rhamnusium bicolor]
MKISFGETYFIITIFLLTSVIRCYDVSLSKNYLKMELNKWSNFTIHIESRGYVYSKNIIMEVNHANDTKVSPKTVEIHSKNFSSWCHMFHVYAIKPGFSRISVHFDNSSLRDKVNDLYIDVDIVKMKVLETYGEWCRKYYYIFSITSVYPQIFLQFLRLSVVGLDMDYVCFNFVGHLSFTVYTIFMYTQTDAYSERNPDEDFPVTLSENMYALHGLIFSIILGIQAVKYFGIDKRVTVVGKELISFYGIVFTFGFFTS